MAKRTVIVCDVCEMQGNPDMFKVTIRKDKHVYEGDVCIECVTRADWDLPTKEKRKYERKYERKRDPHEVTRLHSQKV